MLNNIELNSSLYKEKKLLKFISEYKNKKTSTILTNNEFVFVWITRHSAIIIDLYQNKTYEYNLKKNNIVLLEKSNKNFSF